MPSDGPEGRRTDVEGYGRTFESNDLADSRVIGRLLGEFFDASFRQHGSELLKASRTLARILVGEDRGYQQTGQWSHTCLTAHLRREMPQATKNADDEITAIQEVVVLGALVARHLLEQAADEDQAAAYLRLFLQDWTRLMLGVPMQRQWVEATPRSDGNADPLADPLEQIPRATSSPVHSRTRAFPRLSAAHSGGNSPVSSASSA